MNTIAQEAEACRKAFEGVQVGALVQHCHHAQWLEILTEPAENRIAFILNNKAVSEQAERLRRFRPFDPDKADADWKKMYADREKAYADWKKADAEWAKAYADWKKAYADWEKADAAYPDRKKVDAADADRDKAYADWRKADADWKKADAVPALLAVHAKVCGCAWDATHNIFGKTCHKRS